jgi:aspartate kinase
VTVKERQEALFNSLLEPATKNMRNKLLVMKFGGTSVGSAERMKAACDLIAAEAVRRPVLTVVSAMSKITDLLLDTTRHAEGGDQAGLDQNLRQLEVRHREAAAGLLPASEQARVQEKIDEIISDFRRIVNGIQMLGHRPARAVDEAVAVGERLSALLIAEHLKSRGISAEAVNAAEAIVTDAIFNNASPLMDATEKKANARLTPLLQRGEIPVVTGFNGATADGRPTTLGRGGSDFSASILAAVLNAGELWIWTDVDGIMTADPRLVPDAKILTEITYSEAAELAYAGAKVLHPRTLAPLVERRIPVWSKNSFAPEKPGTRIVPELGEGNPGARAVTSMANVALVSLEPASSGVGGVHIMARSLDALDRANVEVLAISSSSYRQSFCFLVRDAELETSIQAIEAALALELAHGYVRGIDVDRNVGLLAVVGEGMRGFSGVAGRIFTAISREKVNIIAIAQGSSELTISIVVRRDGLEKAVRAVHAECHL